MKPTPFSSSAFARRFALTALAGLLAVAAGCGRSRTAAPSPAPTSSVTASRQVAYYTCTMHPFVHETHPGTCPICGMDLVPVYQKNAAVPAPAAGPMPGGLMPTAENASPAPGEFFVAPERQQMIGVTYGTAEETPLRKTIRAAGVVAPDALRRWEFTPRVSGYVQQLFVASPGEAVKKDQPLLTLYSPELFSTENDFVEALRSRDQARAAGSAELLTAAQQLADSARRRLALWNVTAAQIAAIEQTRAPDDHLTLLSPFAGVVQTVAVAPGARIAAGQPLLSLADLSTVWIWAEFYQEDLPFLKPGLPVTVTTDAWPGETFPGRIALVDSFLNAATRTVRVRLDLPNPGLRLRPAMFVNATLAIDAGRGLTVPFDAVLPTGRHNIVFLDRGGGHLEPRFVQLGGTFDGRYLVTSGLKPGDRIVTSANFLIDAESKIQGALKDW